MRPARSGAPRQGLCRAAGRRLAGAAPRRRDVVRARAARRLRQRLDVFVFPDAPVKASMLTLDQPRRRPRRLSVFGYNAWLLGPPRAGHQLLVVTEPRRPDRRDRRAQSLQLRVRRPRGLLPGASEPVRSMTGDRTEFIGRNGTLSRRRRPWRCDMLSNRLGAGLDPCARAARERRAQPGRDPARGLPARRGRGRSTTCTR